MTADAQSQLKSQIEHMDAQRQQPVQQLETMGKANMDAWQDMQSRFQTACRTMKRGVNDARKRYTKG